ncbi:uncharacterized protein LOC110866755 [Helianthus annuus]|uniref:uncharacterized protein LOC110866755 n=1 Tax=Helianthus annuus TaxID=4232 RepID=UPI000B8F9D9C|nr:uncharacterized protein LOC110866755 [Helianthus annuus]
MAIHGKRRKYSIIPIKNSISGVWKNIVQMGKGSNLKFSNVEKRRELQIGCGDKTYFWLDKWAGDFALKDRFPSLFALQMDKFSLVQHRYSITNDQVSWLWGGDTTVTQLELADLWDECKNLIQNVELKKKYDRWMWKQEDEREEFTIGNLRSELDSMTSIPETQVLKWLSWIPKKINCFLWRAVLDRIPTRDALAIRNIQIPSVVCALCSICSESVDHLLISCQYAQLVWTAISLWVKIPPRYVLGLVGLLEHIQSHCSSQEKKKAVYMIIAATCWILWRIRNNVIFNGKTTNASRKVGDIKALSFV